MRCTKRVHSETPHTTTKPDGTFELDASTGNYYLVVQGVLPRPPDKHRRRAQQIPKDKTTLPAITDKMNGMTFPRSRSSSEHGTRLAEGQWMGPKATISKRFARQGVLAKDAPAFAIYGSSGTRAAVAVSER